jgi:hypothetical protein
VGTEVSRIFSLAFGVGMLVSAAHQLHGPAMWAAGLALAAVFLGVQSASAATGAVLLTTITLALSEPSPPLVVMTGLCATAYLVLRHASLPNSTPPTRVTVAAALGFSLAGVAVTMIPLDVPWLPLVAPFALLGAFALAVEPYVRSRQKSKLEYITAPGS